MPEHIIAGEVNRIPVTFYNTNNQAVTDLDTINSDLKGERVWTSNDPIFSEWLSADGSINKGKYQIIVTINNTNVVNFVNEPLFESELGYNFVQMYNDSKRPLLISFNEVGTSELCFYIRKASEDGWGSAFDYIEGYADLTDQEKAKRDRNTRETLVL